MIDAALRSHQGVISAGSGHINVHETGAVESLGHKVLAVPHKDGKLTAAQVEACIEDVTTHLMNHLSLHPTLHTCSSDTILKMCIRDRK